MSAESVIELASADVGRENTSLALLRNVNWQIARGEFWVVSGDQGSGKSSLLATAAGLNRPGAGTLRIFGRLLGEAAEEEQIDWRRRIGFVFENGGRLLHHLTVAENVALPIQYHLDLSEEETIARVSALLQRADLMAHASTMPSRLNLRLQQRASLMRALAVPTEVLFLDNPLSGLTGREARWWPDFLRERREQQEAAGQPLTVVVGSDDFRAWLEMADHFALIQGDQFRAIGGREEVRASEDAVVRDFV